MNDEDIDRMVSDDDGEKRPSMRQKRKIMVEEWAADLADSIAETQRARWGMD